MITFITLSTLPFIRICIIYTLISKGTLRTTSTTVNSEVVNNSKTFCIFVLMIRKDDMEK